MKRVLLILMLTAAAACTDSPTEAPDETPADPAAPPAAADAGATGDPTAGKAESRTEPDHIKVQHVLIGFKDAVGFRGRAPKGAAGRTQEEARILAEAVLKRAQGGEDFLSLVKEFTDDSPPGIYAMANHGVAAPAGTFERSGMVPAFGDTGFPLEVGEVGLAAYDPTTSPYGWHIVKRIE